MPSIASVGLSEEDAEKQHEVVIYDSKFRAMRNTLSGAQSKAI